MAVRPAAGLLDDTGEESTALHHLLGVLLVDLEASLDDHHVAAIFLVDVADVGDTIRNNVIWDECRVLLHSPVGVERHADHVELAAVLEDRIQVVVVERLEMTSVEVDDDDSVWEDLLDSVVASADKAGVLLRFSLDMSHRVGYRRMAEGVLDFPAPFVSLDTPEHTVGSLVADLDPAGVDVVVAEERQDVDSM